MVSPPINKQCQTEPGVTDASSSFDGFTGFGANLDRPNHIDGSIGSRVGGIHAEDAPSIGEVHFSKVVSLARIEVVSDEVSRREPGTAGEIEFAAGGSVVEFAIMAKSQGECGVGDFAFRSKLRNGEITEGFDFVGAGVKGKEIGSALFNAVSDLL